jgi:hypothetical protein
MNIIDYIRRFIVILPEYINIVIITNITDVLLTHMIYYIHKLFTIYQYI